MSAVLDHMTPGFRDAVHGSQQTFRAVLDAVSHPGRVMRLPQDACEGLVPPPSRDPHRPMSMATAALGLALLDAETSVAVTGRLASDAAVAWLRFHTGVRPAPHAAASFTLASGDELDAAGWSRLELGSDEVPQDGGTLVIEVDHLGAGVGDVVPRAKATTLVLSGPGIERETRFVVAGPTDAFWAWRIGLQALLPRGIDLILACDVRIAALPRSTRVALEA